MFNSLVLIFQRDVELKKNLTLKKHLQGQKKHVIIALKIPHTDNNLPQPTNLT